MKKIILNSVFLFSIHFIFSQNYQLDTTFGTGGKVLNSNIPNGQLLQSQPDGKIIACFLASFSINGNMRLTRYNIDGSLDTSFGINGFVNSIVVSEAGGLNMMKVQSDGKILITGFISSNGTANSTFFNFCTARFNVNGSIDTSFGANGYVITDVQNESADISSVIEIQIDGKILIGGSSSNSYLVSSNFSSDFACVRYFANGLIDNSFAVNGRFVYNFGSHSIPSSGTNSSEFISSIGINSLGSIILGGNSTVNQFFMNFNKCALVSLNQNGILNTNFGTNGQRIIDFVGNESFKNFKITSDDKVIVAASYSYAVQTIIYNKIAMAKLLSNGSLDATFGTNGIVLTNRDSTNLIDTAGDFVLQSDGKIVVIGSTIGNTANQSDFLTIRFNTNGTIDNTLNNIGYFTTDFSNTDNLGLSMVIQNNGKIICTGRSTIGNNAFSSVSRHEPVPLSTINFDAKNNFKAYPNPFSNSINLDFDTNENQISTIELLDINGRKIEDLLKNQKINAGNNKLHFDLPPSLSKGVYFLKISNDKDFKTIKIIK